MRSTRMILLRTIAAELIEHAVKDPDWFADLADVLDSMGYRLIAQQQGIRGTYITIVAVGDVAGNQ